MKNKVCLFLFILLFILSSCGVPDIFVPSSSSINFRFSSSVDNVYECDINVLNDLYNEGNSPELFLFYLVESKESDGVDSNFKTLISDFSKEYCTETSGIPIGDLNYEKEYSSPTEENDEAIKNVYKFSQFKYSKDMSQYFNDASVSARLGWHLQFTYDKEQNELSLVLFDKPFGDSGRREISEKIILRRNNDEKFSDDCFSDELPDSSRGDSPNEELVIKVYGVVSFDFAKATNHFNTAPSYNSPLFTFNVEI